MGTGPCGAAAAWSLHREGIAFTVLEAGDEDGASGLVVRAPGLTLVGKRRELVPPANVAPAESDCREGYVELSPRGLSHHWTCPAARFSKLDFGEGPRLH